jgi:hypothetical protein
VGGSSKRYNEKTFDKPVVIVTQQKQKLLKGFSTENMEI